MLTLRGYQGEAVDAIVAGLATGGRGQLIAACGTGKTLVALRAAVRLCPPGGLVVVACPSLALVAQTVDVWLADQAADRVLVVCGDKTVTDAAVHTSDLPCPVTRDPAEIAAWLHVPGPRRRLLVTTHTSADVAGAGLQAAGTPADLLVVDEAHRTAGRSDKHSAVVHHDRGLTAARRLYLTATPRFLASNATNPSHADDASGMDDPRVFGPVLHRYPFGQAIADGWLDDYQVAVIGVTQPEALKALRELDDDALLDVRDAPLRTAVVQTGLARAVREWDLLRIIAFTPRVAQSREFAMTLPQTLRSLPDPPERRVTSRFVHGGMTMAQRNAVLADLRNPPADSWTVVANSRCLAEGVDVPAVDGVLFTRPKESTIDVIQAIGRALRRNPGGSGLATIIVPVLLPDTPDATPGVDDQDEYKTLWQILRALRAHDETLGAELDLARLNHHRGDAPWPDLPTRVLLRLPDGYDTAHYLRHITIRLLERTTSPWVTGYAAASRYHAEHGHLRIPTGTHVDNVPLDVWINYQRKQYRARSLPPDRVADLDRLGIVWDPRDEFWQAGIAAASRFHQEHGHLWVPEGTVVAGLDLCKWLARRRRDYKHGLAAERVEALNRLGMVWEPDSQRWRAGFAAARRYHGEHGHLRVPEGMRVEGVFLAPWLQKQRQRHRSGTLSAERIQALEQLGIVWEPHTTKWQAALAVARQYQRDHGDIRVPSGTRIQGVLLAPWLARQRDRYKSGRLSAEQMHALEQLGAV